MQLYTSLAWWFKLSVILALCSASSFTGGSDADSLSSLIAGLRKCLAGKPPLDAGVVTEIQARFERAEVELRAARTMAAASADGMRKREAALHRAQVLFRSKMLEARRTRELADRKEKEAMRAREVAERAEHEASKMRKEHLEGERELGLKREEATRLSEQSRTADLEMTELRRQMKDLGMRDLGTLRRRLTASRAAVQHAPGRPPSTRGFVGAECGVAHSAAKVSGSALGKDVRDKSAAKARPRASQGTGRAGEEKCDSQAQGREPEGRRAEEVRSAGPVIGEKKADKVEGVEEGAVDTKEEEEGDEDHEPQDPRVQDTMLECSAEAAGALSPNAQVPVRDSSGLEGLVGVGGEQGQHGSSGERVLSVFQELAPAAPQAVDIVGNQGIHIVTPRVHKKKKRHKEHRKKKHSAGRGSADWRHEACSSPS